MTTRTNTDNLDLNSDYYRGFSDAMDKRMDLFDTMTKRQDVSAEYRTAYTNAMLDEHAMLYEGTDDEGTDGPPPPLQLLH